MVTGRWDLDLEVLEVLGKEVRFIVMVIVALQQYTMLRNLQPKVDTRHGIFLTKTKTFLPTYSVSYDALVQGFKKMKIRTTSNDDREIINRILKLLRSHDIQDIKPLMEFAKEKKLSVLTLKFVKQLEDRFVDNAISIDEESEDSEPLHEGQAYAIGIGYSYDKCVEKGPPTKFIKITTPEFFKWLTQKRENIIDVNHKECTLGKGPSTKHVENKGGA